MPLALPDVESPLATRAAILISVGVSASQPEAVLPVNYKWHDGAVVFRTAQHSALDEDLQTGIAGGDYLVAFEIDEIDLPGRQGWSVLIQGPAHHVEGETERASAEEADVEPWPAGERELFLRIVSHRVTGRRIQSA